MRVRITKSSDPTDWYRNHIGTDFEVFALIIVHGYYTLKSSEMERIANRADLDTENSDGLIRICDCEFRKEGYAEFQDSWDETVGQIRSGLVDKAVRTMQNLKGEGGNETPSN